VRFAATVGALLLLSASAAAQPQMPDPRQMSGMARPQQGDPAGQLTVRVVQGKMTVDQFGNSNTKFPPAHPVHLIAVGADGSVAKTTLLLDDNGRAVFKGLATDGTYAYYAATLLPRGEVQDRVLTTEPVGMPPQVGMRLMLAGLDPTSTEPAVDDSADPRIPKRPPGEVLVEIRGAARNINEVRLVEVGSGNATKVEPQTLQDAKVARFLNVPGGNDRVYVAQVVHEGRVYRSLPVQLNSTDGAVASIFVYPTLLMQFHSGAEIDDDKLWFQIQFTLANGTGAPLDPGDDGILIPLPRGFLGASVDEASGMRVKVLKGQGFVWNGPFPPGQRTFVGQFALPADGGRAELVMDMPFGLIDSQVSLRSNAGVVNALKRCLERGQSQEVCTAIEGGKVVETSQAGPMRFSTLEGGITFLVIPRINVAMGQQLRITFSGLPMPPSWWRPARLVAGIAVLLFLLLGATGAVLHVRHTSAARDVKLDELMLQRHKLFDQLVKLETRHRDGKLPDGAFQQQRADLKSKLIKIANQVRARKAA